MKLQLIGHDSRYAMEQLALILFPQEKIEYVQTDFTGDGAVSALHQGETWVTATAKITRNGETARGTARCRREKLTERLLPQKKYPLDGHSVYISKLICLVLAYLTIHLSLSQVFHAFS